MRGGPCCLVLATVFGLLSSSTLAISQQQKAVVGFVKHQVAQAIFSEYSQDLFNELSLSEARLTDNPSFVSSLLVSLPAKLHTANEITIQESLSRAESVLPQNQNIAGLTRKHLKANTLSSSSKLTIDDSLLESVTRQYLAGAANPLSAIDNMYALATSSDSKTKELVTSAEMKTTSCGYNQYLVVFPGGYTYCSSCENTCNTPCPATWNYTTTNSISYCESCPSGFHLVLDNGNPSSKYGYCSECEWMCASMCPATSTSYLSCTSCYSGYTLVDDDGDGFGYCTQCGNSGCKDCPAVTNTTTECSSCKKGYFLVESTKRCSSCDYSCATTCPVTNPTQHYCTNCKSGYFFRTDTSQCDNCSPGCVDDCPVSSNGPYCTACKPGYYFESGRCFECPSNCLGGCTTRNNTQGGPAYSCTACKSGSFLRVNPEIGSAVCDHCIQDCAESCPWQWDQPYSYCTACSSPNQRFSLYNSDSYDWFAYCSTPWCPSNCANCTGVDNAPCAECKSGHTLISGFSCKKCEKGCQDECPKVSYNSGLYCTQCKDRYKFKSSFLPGVGRCERVYQSKLFGLIAEIFSLD